MIKRTLKYGGIFLLLVLLTVLAVAAWLTGTERGFQQTLALAKKFAPGELAWAEADGKLGGEFSINGLQYSQPGGLDASIDDINFNWRPAALFSTELAIDQLHLDGITVRLPQADSDELETEPASTGELPDIALPVSINLADVSVTNVAVFPPGQDTAIEIDRVTLRGNVHESSVKLDTLEVVAPQGQLSLTGSVTTRDAYPMDLAAKWQADIGQSSPLNGEGTFTGSLDRLQLNHQLTGFVVADVNAELSDVVRAPSWDGTIEASLPNANALSDKLTGTPAINLQTSGNLDQYQAKTTLLVDTTDTGPVTVNVSVTGSSEALEIQSLLADLQNSGDLSASGQLTFATLDGDIEGQWQSLGWPVQSEPQFTSSSGSFSFKGSPENFDVNVLTDIAGAAIPAGEWAASASGSATALNSFELSGQTLGGRIVATGNAAWETQPLWDVDLVTENLNPGLQWEAFPGSISLQASSRGQTGDDGVQLLAQLDQLSGSLLEQALNGSGSVKLEGEALTVENLELAHGPSRLSANGMIDQQIDLDFALDSPDLATLLPELAGAIALSGTLSGSRESPAIVASGIASNLVFQQNRLSSLNLNVDAGLGADVSSTLSVVATGITAGTQQIQNVALDGQGTQDQHSVTLSANTDLGNVETQLDGSLRENSWTGFLSTLQLDNTPAGNWQLREPVAISASADEVNAALLCLDNTDRLGGLCVEGSRLSTGQLSANASIIGLSPQLASAYLPPGITVQTRLNGTATAQMDQAGALTAQANLELDPGKLALENEGSTVDILLERTTVDLSLLDDNASMKLTTALTDLGELTASATISDPAGAATIVGKLDADFPDITLISAFAPQLQQVSGKLLGNMSVAGTLQAPEIQGDLSLVDFNAEIPQTAMLIKDTQLNVRGIPDGTLLISGESRSGDGQLGINGNFNPATRALELSVDGENYQVANTAMLQLEVSPQLDIEMHDSGMQVNGEVTIPRAYINANGGNEGIRTVSASSDVVYVSEQGEEEPESPPSQISLDVQVNLGDSVEVEAGDFRGRLDGDLRVQQTPELAPLGTGTINVLNGDYVVYGQQLNMERGRILFSGGPVDNPTLDMEVARTVQEYEVVAGARIQGTAQTPRLELYSDPPMPDASILSYILLGQPPGATGASYTLGKYLTPDLYVSYGIGLFDAINTFNMRYTLTDKLSVEAASGAGSSADIIYTIER